jgi:hypothetical protein
VDCVWPYTLLQVRIRRIVHHQPLRCLTALRLRWRRCHARQQTAAHTRCTHSPRHLCARFSLSACALRVAQVQARSASRQDEATRAPPHGSFRADIATISPTGHCSPCTLDRFSLTALHCACAAGASLRVCRSATPRRTTRNMPMMPGASPRLTQSNTAHALPLHSGSRAHGSHSARTPTAFGL